MKNFVLATALSISMTAPAFAETVSATITDHYKIVISQTPYSVEVCRDVAVSGDKTGDTLKGAIIGGIIGNNVTKNVDNGGAVGAIIGGMIGHNNSNATGGTRRVCEVQTRYNEEVIEVYSHSVVTFYHNGKKYQLRFQK